MMGPHPFESDEEITHTVNNYFAAQSQQKMSFSDNERRIIIECCFLT